MISYIDGSNIDYYFTIKVEFAWFLKEISASNFHKAFHICLESWNQNFLGENKFNKGVLWNSLIYFERELIESLLTKFKNFNFLNWDFEDFKILELLFTRKSTSMASPGAGRSGIFSIKTLKISIPKAKV